MRLALLPATLLAACVMTGAPGLAGPVALACPDAGETPAGRLCTALGEELRRRGHQTAGPQGEAMRLTLRTRSPRPEMLLARLTVEEGAARRDGPELELSVMDRRDIPDSELARLARLLLDQTLAFEK